MRIQPLNEEKMKEAGWEDIYISGYSQKVHIFQHVTGKENKNIMILHTPVTAVKNCYECFEQLGRVYSFNVFALDYAPGEGECSGVAKDFTLENMTANLNAVYNYICEKYSDDIHFLGYTGVGGIMAQYYIGINPKFKSFSQFACGIYGNITPLGVPNFLAKPLLGFCRMLVKIKPDLTIPFSPPKAKGFHAELDNEFYETIISMRAPDFFDLKVNSLLQTLECMVGKKSTLKKPIECPTLVFKTLHDRYFSTEYFDSYYDALICEKKLVEINDVHNSYFITPELFMREIADWVNSH